MSSSSLHSVPDCCTAIQSELLNSDQNPDFPFLHKTVHFRTVFVHVHNIIPRLSSDLRCNNLHQYVPSSSSLPRVSFFQLIVDLPWPLLSHYSHQACYAPWHSSSILPISANQLLSKSSTSSDQCILFFAVLVNTHQTHSFQQPLALSIWCLFSLSSLSSLMSCSSLVCWAVKSFHFTDSR